MLKDAREATVTQTIVIAPNTFAVIDYVLRDEEGELLDDSAAEDGEPIRYVHGYGMLVPGLETGLAGLAPGEERDIVVPAEEAYGDYDEELVMEIDRTELPDPTAVEEGDELIAQAPDGDEALLRVVEVKKDTVVVDANHPLAGLTLRYHVKVSEVRAATPEEVAAAASGFDEASEHVHGPDCDHDHDGEPLVPLGKKKPN